MALSIPRLLGAGLFTLMATAAFAQPPARPTVLAVFWSAEEFPSNQVRDAAIREALGARSDTPVDYFAEYLESDVFPDERASGALRDYIRAKYAGRRIDVVVAVTDVALQFVLRYRDELFRGAPIVHLTTLGPNATIREAGAGATGVVMGGGFADTLKLALRLHPSTTRVFVVAKWPNLDVDTLRRQLGAFDERVEMTYLVQESVPELLEAVSRLPSDSLILFYRHSDIGVWHDSTDVARRMSEVATAPIYVGAESFIGTGAVGGMVFDLRALGHRIGELTRQVLDGADAGEIPVERAELVPMFDWRQLRRWDVNTSRLPPGTIMRFRTPTMWDQYHQYIVGAVAFGILQGAIIVALMVERAARRRTQKRYALASEAGAVGVWDWNLDTDQMYLDPILKGLLGYTDSDIRNDVNDWFGLVHPDDASYVKGRVAEVLDGTTDSYEVERRMLHRDGSVRWFLARGSVVSRNGRVTHLAGTDTDITARKASEQALHDTQAELMEISRFTALGEYAASVAHEVRQPLTAIIMTAKTCLRWLGDGVSNPRDIREALEDVVDAGMRAGEMIQRNGELFRRHKVAKEPLDLNAVVRDVQVLVAARLRNSQVTLRVSLDSPLPAIFGDRIELQQVLLNLIANASDAMEGVDRAQRVIEVSCRVTPEGYVKVSVRDNGVGLTGVDTQRLFSLMYTTKPHGTGIGLSLSRTIVRAHGGTLWAEQNAGSGATFCFTLPVHDAVTPAIPVTTRSASVA